MKLGNLANACKFLNWIFKITVITVVYMVLGAGGSVLVELIEDNLDRKAQIEQADKANRIAHDLADAAQRKKDDDARTDKWFKECGHDNPHWRCQVIYKEAGWD